MNVINEVFPSDPEQLKGMMEKGPDGPIFMVNLLKFKDKAEYEDGRETNLTGREAYMIYGRAVAELLPKFGGRGIFAGDVTYLSLGRVEELWDEIAIAMYPGMRLPKPPPVYSLMSTTSSGLMPTQRAIEGTVCTRCSTPSTAARMRGTRWQATPSGNATTTAASSDPNASSR